MKPIYTVYRIVDLHSYEDSPKLVLEEVDWFEKEKDAIQFVDDYKHKDQLTILKTYQTF